MNEEVKEAMETALRAFKNYEKYRYQFYGATKDLAIEQLKKCLNKESDVN